MKKILFASTALVFGAGAASADLAFSGLGRFGVTYVEERDVYTGDAAREDWELHSRFQFDIAGTTEADNGIQFGAKVRMRITSNGETMNGNGGNGGYGFNDPQFWVSSEGLTFEMGNVDYALDNMPGLSYPAPGLVGLEFISPASDNIPGYGSNTVGGDQAVAALYEMDGFAAHISYIPASENTDMYVAYTFSGYTFALGYQDGDAYETEWAAAVSGSLAGVDWNISYADNGPDGDAYGLGGSYDVSSALSISGFYGNVPGISNIDPNDDDNYGLGAQYDLGGGASLRGAIGHVKGADAADFGVVFNF